MNKKYFSLISLGVFALLLGGLLSGCGLQPSDEESDDNSDMPLEESTATEPTPSAQSTATPPASSPADTDAELQQQLKDLDISLDTVKTTGFEQKDLSDKDLGL